MDELKSVFSKDNFDFLIACGYTLSFPCYCHVIEQRFKCLLICVPRAKIQQSIFYEFFSDTPPDDR